MERPKGRPPQPLIIRADSHAVPERRPERFRAFTAYQRGTESSMLILLLADR